MIFNNICIKEILSNIQYFNIFIILVKNNENSPILIVWVIIIELIGDFLVKILVVDDSSMMRKAISKIVTINGFIPIVAENGAVALERLQENEKDIALIIMDWNMPVLDGYETLVEIRSKEQYNNVPVLMATAAGIQSDIDKAIKAGADGYLVKPFKPEGLSKKINEILND